MSPVPSLMRRNQIHTRPIGRSGVSVSAVGLGGYELGPEPGAEPDVDSAEKVIRTALEAGVDWLDTSENYLDTHNEALIGEALARVDDDFLVASKAAPGTGVTGGGSGFRREEIHAACRASLDRLGREHIDIYFLHWPDRTGVPLDETWAAMAELAEAGLVRAIGLSNYSLEDVERCHAERPVDAVQVGLSMIDYLDDRPSIARFGELGMGVTAYEPLASGVLSGKTLDQVRAVWTGPWEETEFYRNLLDPVWAARCSAVLEGLRLIADRFETTVAQLAIAWVLAQPGVSAAIVGSRDGRHMMENAGASDLDLSDALDELERLVLLGPNVSDRAGNGDDQSAQG
jgi:aryl-alcohol dehydrogenase-like predicted oxidoreductase